MSQQNLEVVRESVQAFSDGDMERLADCYSQGASITAVPEGWPETGPFNGRDEVSRQFTRLREDWEQHSMRIRKEVTDGNWVLMEFLWSAQGVNSGVALDMTVIGAYRLEAGKIAEARFFWKWTEALEAVGLPQRDLEPPAPEAEGDRAGEDPTSSLNPLHLIEFPADDAERARRFWSGLLGVSLEPREAGEGSGWQTHSSSPTLGIHERGTGPGDTFSLPYFAVEDMRDALARVEALGGTVIHPGERWAICKDSEGSPFGLAAKG